jgi:hypothetical protein
MEILPSDVCKHIAGFLDYNSRVNYNTVVGPSEKCVNRIKSFEHDLTVKADILHKKMNEHTNSTTPIDQAKTLLEVFRYINKNTVLIEHTRQAFRDMVFTKATQFNKSETFTNFKLPYFIQKLIMEECFRSLCLLEVYSFKGDGCSKLHVPI